MFFVYFGKSAKLHSIYTRVSALIPVAYTVLLKVGWNHA